MKKRQSVIVIHEKDLSDGERMVIGVVSSRAIALELIKEYYGDDAVITDLRDIRDNNLDFDLKVKGSDCESYVWGEDFVIDTL